MCFFFLNLLVSILKSELANIFLHPFLLKNILDDICRWWRSSSEFLLPISVKLTAQLILVPKLQLPRFPLEILNTRSEEVALSPHLNSCTHLKISSYSGGGRHHLGHALGRRVPEAAEALRGGGAPPSDHHPSVPYSDQPGGR